MEFEAEVSPVDRPTFLRGTDVLFFKMLAAKPGFANVT
jgi:hypothetical protein